MGFRRWKLPQADPDRVKNFIDQTGMPPIAAQILEGRGVSEPEQAKAYAGFDREAKMHDPFLMADMRQAVERLARALEEGEQIAVYGDYDCDGITATAMLYTYLEDLGARVIYYIPDRDQEGYGLNRSALDFLKEQKEKYVIMADTNLAVNFDFNAMIEAHMESGADVTVAYTEQPLPDSILDAPHTSKDMYYTLSLDEGRVSEIQINSKETGVQNLSMNIYIIERQRLIDLVSKAYVLGQIYFERDVLAPNLKTLNVQTFRFDGYIARISDMKSYFEENMKMLDDENVDALFYSGDPIYTKIRDDNPTRYINGSRAKNIMAADGCVIEGDVENSILFRGVKIAKGAKVRNCVLMQGTSVEAGASLEYVITDKNVTITEYKELKGNDAFPVYVAKYQKV